MLNDYVTLLDTPYQRYLKSTCSEVSEVHKGYFSIDKKGHAIDSKLKRGSEFSDDISAYDLILKNKERLLSFDEPTRFIFSHSALREGWDNPNVFQICTLKHSDSNTAKRQEVGRGLRLCVNQSGNRMDLQTLGENVHDINSLTVVASESYKTFVGDLQSDIKTVLYDRPTVATSEYFKGKYVKVDDVPTLIDDSTANNIEFYLIQNGYVDMDRKATMIVEHISYDTIEGEYDSTIFTAEKNTQSFDKAFLAKKAIQDYVFTDGSAEKSIERRFAEDLDAAEEVCVYAKLPRTFQIPTPVGNYSPDWAIAFYEGKVKHIFFVAETKGTMESLELRPIEQAKISCAKKLFNEMSNSKVVYHDVDSYQSLLNIMNSI